MLADNFSTQKISEIIANKSLKFRVQNVKIFEIFFKCKKSFRKRNEVFLFLSSFFMYLYNFFFFSGFCFSPYFHFKIARATLSHSRTATTKQSWSHSYTFNIKPSCTKSRAQNCFYYDFEKNTNLFDKNDEFWPKRLSST